MRRIVVTPIVAASVFSAQAVAQDCTSSGADLLIAAINTVSNYTAVGEHDAFSANYVACNVGSIDAGWNSSSADHPAFSMGLYRVVTIGGASRVEQIGMSWTHHATSGALNSNFCCSGCGSGALTMFLAPNCSTTSSASFIGTQQSLGPRYQVHASDGAFSFPFNAAATQDGTSRRLRARVGDLLGSAPSTRYFLEMQLVSADDAADANIENNATTREVQFSGSQGERNMAMGAGGTTHVGRAAIFEWQAIHPSVVVRTVEVPGDGVVFVAANVVDIGGGQWRYDYAIQNLNSDRGVRAFSLPLDGCTAVEQIGFHDVEYHSGDGIGNVNFDGTDWIATVGGGSVSWSTSTFAENQGANAIRWGTLYSFSFVANAAADPASTATLGLFTGGLPASVEVGGIPAPLGAPAPMGDLDSDCDVDLSDLARMLGTFGLCAGDAGYFASADLSNNGCVDLGDLALLLANFGL